MKQKIILMAIIALLAGTFSSCQKEEETINQYPTLYVVNGTDYYVDVYCDNVWVASAGAHNNSNKVVLSNISINLPVYVEAEFYDSKNRKIHKYSWTDYYFKWNNSYKMTLTNSASTSNLSSY